MKITEKTFYRIVEWLGIAAVVFTTNYPVTSWQWWAIVFGVAVIGGANHKIGELSK